MRVVIVIAAGEALGFASCECGVVGSCWGGGARVGSWFRVACRGYVQSSLSSGVICGRRGNW
eukprot:2648255-Alexandrium_andersonii.AAC.1